MFCIIYSCNQNDSGFIIKRLLKLYYDISTRSLEVKETASLQPLISQNLCIYRITNLNL